MKIRLFNSAIFLSVILILTASCSNNNNQQIGHTEVEKWQDGKTAAVTLTYDDGSANQFNVALPIMNKLELPATFFINTGNI